MHLLQYICNLSVIFTVNYLSLHILVSKSSTVVCIDEQNDKNSAIFVIFEKWLSINGQNDTFIIVLKNIFL